MKNNIFPAAIIQQTVEVYDSHISVRSKAIYLLFLGILLANLICLSEIGISQRPEKIGEK